ncbi:unnamed protein product [Soboliphyme baturini]|uniref:Sister chromatid cohesion protein DCC1 n=1 Tax=Soboliphyme baturini TaxID=241478 RepID=A0A183IL93_9BILA|nr:unnamed protein product [Soboliphyme baturini]
MTTPKVVTAEVFKTLLNEDFSVLLKSCDRADWSLLYPYLLRLIVYEGVVPSHLLTQKQNVCREALLNDFRVNRLNEYLNVAFPELEVELLKDLQTRRKSTQLQTNKQELKSTTTVDVALRFENGDVAQRYFILLSELLSTQQSLSDGFLTSECLRFELLDNLMYLDECSDMLCFAVAEMPQLLSVDGVCEPLLCYRNGPVVIQRLVANFPHTFSVGE